MALQWFSDDKILFSSTIDPEVDVLLQRAVQHYYTDNPTSEKFLWQAQAKKPEQLEVYVALYKFYFYQNRLEEAENAARLGLKMCAQVIGITDEWQSLTPASAKWENAEGAERLFLYTLKALSFIRLRQQVVNESQAILSKLNELDPRDQVGWSVIQELLTRCQEDEDENEE